MTTITAPLRRSSPSVRTPSAPVWTSARRVLRSFRHLSEGLNSDDRATLCELTLRPYPEARSAR